MKNIYDDYEKSLLDEGYTEEQLKQMHVMLRAQIHSYSDSWGPCCFGCELWGDPIKGCGLYCLKDKPEPANKKKEIKKEA